VTNPDAPSATFTMEGTSVEKVLRFGEEPSGAAPNAGGGQGGNPGQRPRPQPAPGQPNPQG